MKILHFLTNILFALILISCHTVQKKEQRQPSILFIAVDDLRPELGCYGQLQIKSPNIDKLAAEGLTFINAYCNVPVCGASRASLLTGIRPSMNRFVNWHTYAQDDAPDAISLPEHFKNNGYYTLSLGKVFHHIDDMAESWSEKPWSPVEETGYLDYISKENKEIMASIAERGFPFEIVDVDDESYHDGKIALRAIEKLKQLKMQDKPFFLATGFLRPHLPFNAPQKYWDLYPEESIHLPDNYFNPKNVPDIAIHKFGELRAYFGVPAEGAVSDKMAHELIRGYYASVSYVDAQIGKVLDALEVLGLAENTIVILWGDHGWQLGEHALWCKHANFKTSLNAPLIIKTPGFKGQLKTKGLVEFIDIYPSLCELAGLSLPDQLHGKSFVPFLKDPGLHWKNAVFSRFHKGESVITKRYLYTEWFDEEGNGFDRMIYDHENDPEENVNIIDQS
ncbi:MAG: sulfatase, partial [Bacteroidales bacterium]|nr:sulfatase [Bacteroidales bacterium]